MTDIEQWRPIGVGTYEVSSLGRVRHGRRMLKPQTRNGYLRACLSERNVKAYRAVHRLVAAAFLGPPPEGHDVAHLNGQRDDNRLSNLAYKTRAQNEADKIAHGTSQHGQRNHMAKLTAEDVRTIRERVAAGTMQKTIAAEYGVAKITVSQIVTGKRWTGTAEVHP